MSTPNRVTLTAPKKIWLQISDEKSDRKEPFTSSCAEITWCEDSVLACEVKYVRADLVRAKSRPSKRAKP